jgi:hypothetical protein
MKFVPMCCCAQLQQQPAAAIARSHVEPGHFYKVGALCVAVKQQREERPSATVDIVKQRRSGRPLGDGGGVGAEGGDVASMDVEEEALEGHADRDVARARLATCETP